MCRPGTQIPEIKWGVATAATDAPLNGLIRPAAAAARQELRTSLSHHLTPGGLKVLFKKNSFFNPLNCVRAATAASW